MMTFKKFVATKQEFTRLEDNEILKSCGDYEGEGITYVDTLVIQKLNDEYYLVIENCEYVGPLHELEAELYAWARVADYF